MLLKAGVDKDAAKIDGVPALMAAAWNGRVDVVRMLLVAWADKTALEAAAWNAHVNVVCMLLEAGAGRNADGALVSAVWKGHLEVVLLLFEAGADSRMATWKW